VIPVTGWLNEMPEDLTHGNKYENTNKQSKCGPSVKLEPHLLL